MRRQPILWLALSVLGLMSIGCAAMRPAAEPAGPIPLDLNEQVQYHFELTHSKDSYVCAQMSSVYNHAFKNPWNFRAFMTSHYPAVANSFYGPARKPLTDETRRVFYMRYALSPTTPEFDQIKWTEGNWIGDSTKPLPLLWAIFDIDNDGDDELAIQQVFYGWGDHRTAADIYLLGEDPAALERSKTLFTKAELTGLSSGTDGALVGKILRFFRLGGVTYLGSYETSPSSGKTLERHWPPETMLVKRVLMKDGTKAVRSLETVCEFEMQRIVDPLSDSRK